MRSQRFWVPVGMLAASFIGGGLANIGFANKNPEILERVQARSFQVVDADGKLRGSFGTMPDGPVRLELFDKDGKARGVFGVLPDAGAGLQLYDKDGKRRGGFVMMRDGRVSLVLLDKDTKIIFQAP